MKMAAVAIGLCALALPCAAAGQAAPPADQAPRQAAAGQGLHWAAGVGGFVGLSGPAAYGSAAELQLYPGGPAGRLGAALRYRGFAGRGFEAWSSGMATAGLVYAAGVSRPGLVLELHGEAGFTHGPGHPAAGGGVRLQIGLWGPLALAIDTGVHLIFDGIDTRLSLAPGLTLGLAR